MNRTMLAGLGLVALVCAVFVGYRFGHDAHSVPDVSFGAERTAPASAFSDELEKIRKAELIEDPVSRCLGYPNPTEFTWDAAQVRQLCRKSQWRMLSWQEIKQALDDRHPEKIDAAFDTYLAQNFNDPEAHGFLTWTYWWMFQNSSADVLALTQRWIAMAPKSGYAWAARGIHYSQAAYDARGGKKLSNTPLENVSRMNALVDASRADLRKSLQINPRLIAAYHGLLRIERLGHSLNETLDGVVRQALSLDDADPWIYQDWLDDVEPQWGGSTIEMQRVAQQAASHAGKNPLLTTLQAEPLCNTADQYRCTECARDGAKALDFYKQAGGFGPSACFLEGAGAAAVLAEDAQTAVRYYSQAVRFIGGADWLAYRAQSLHSIGENEWALADLKKAIAANPKNTTALYGQGLIFAAMHRDGDAEMSYRKILDIDPDHQNAAITLSILYLTDPSALYAPEKARPLVARLLKNDPTLPHGWLLKAALSWIDKDPAAYIEAGENYLRLVDHDDRANTSDIEAIQKRLVQARQFQAAQQGSSH